MTLQALLIVGIVIVILVLVVTLISVNRAYAFKHTIDDIRKDSYNPNRAE